MKVLIFVCLALSATVRADDDDDKCKNDLATFMQCAKDQVKTVDVDAKKQEMKKKIDDCFAQNDCDAPAADSKNPMASMGKGAFDMPDSVKQCLKRKMAEKIGQKLNECLSKQGVKNVNFSALMEMPGAGGLGDDMASHKDGAKDMLMMMMMVVKAMRKCVDKKGGSTDAIHPLEQCVYDVKRGVKPQVCATLKPCMDKVSAPCKSRHDQVSSAICKCKKEKEAQVADRLKSLPQDRNVTISELIKTVMDDGDDPSKMLDDVDACYKEAGEQPSPIIALARMMMSGGGGGAMAKFQPTVDPKTVTIVRDMLTLCVNDADECKPCDA